MALVGVELETLQTRRPLDHLSEMHINGKDYKRLQ